MIKKAAFVAHPTRDIEASKRFYGEILGLSSTANFGDYWSEFQAGGDGTTIALDTCSPQKDPEARPYLALETDDITAEIARLKEAGVQVVHEAWENTDQDGTSVCKMALIADPDGNVLMLHEIAPHRT